MRKAAAWPKDAKQFEAVRTRGDSLAKLQKLTCWGTGSTPDKHNSGNDSASHGGPVSPASVADLEHGGTAS